MGSPVLLSELRKALQILYFAPSFAVSNSSHQSHEAHTFLLKVQSRNVRRKLHSLKQKERDQQQQQQQHQLADEFPGSSWLACLALLCTADAHSAERLFAAQTLLHRISRAKLYESIDLEMENSELIQSLQEGGGGAWLADVVMEYSQAMRRIHPLLGALVDSWIRDRGDLMNALTEEHEDQIKGELTLLTISTIQFMTAAHASAADAASDPNTKPLLFTLGSVLAVTALRLRYTPQSVSTTNNGTANSTPLVRMVTRSLHLVAQLCYDPDNDPQGLHNLKLVLHSCLCICTAAIPDAILAGPGGARGRLSIDPRCIHAAHAELQCPDTGVSLLWEAIQNVPADDQVCHECMLTTCERWAKFLPLPLDFIRHTMPMVRHYLSAENGSPVSKAAWSYLLSIYEAGCWTREQILSFSLGLSSDQLIQQATKKRQSSKSKKRQKEAVGNTTDDRRASAESECRHRGEAAVLATELVWTTLGPASLAALERTDTIDEVSERINCLCACANACLPHIVRHRDNERQDMAAAVINVFQKVCSHPSRVVRALSYEPLFALHDALLLSGREQASSPEPPNSLETLFIDHLVHCSMKLAASCGYPMGYFDDLAAESDQDIEIERNDIRDVLRTVAGTEGTNLAREDRQPVAATLTVSARVLDRLVKHCAEAISERDENGLPHETAFHALSSLAKPLGQFASDSARINHLQEFDSTVRVATFALGDVCSCLLERLAKLDSKILLPTSRLAGIATASFAPLLSAICINLGAYGISGEDFQKILCACAQAAALSLAHIPELAAVSSLDHAMYDIVGAMRGPGGEDHVGCLALMRLTTESDPLTLAVTRASSFSGTTFPLELCSLHQELKAIENTRDPGVFHGKGVTPKSRRILLNTICRLAALDSQTDGPSAKRALHGLFQDATLSITTLLSDQHEMNEELLFRLCEETFDLASHSPDMVSSLFMMAHEQSRHFVAALLEAVRSGYSHLLAKCKPHAVHVQWSRFLASLFTLIKSSSSPDLPLGASAAVVAFTQAECAAIRTQCDWGPDAASSLFDDLVISDNHVPAGIFIRAVGEVIESAMAAGSESISLEQCAAALHDARLFVSNALLHECPDPRSFEDPRPALCEAWFFALAALAKFTVGNIDSTIEALLSEACCTAIFLLVRAPIGKHQDQQAGLSLDGPQSRAIVEYFEQFFSLGSQMLQSTGAILNRNFHLAYGSDGERGESDFDKGIGLVGAALLRGISGSLPPWTIEEAPHVFAALYKACGMDSNVFCQLLRASMELRLSLTSPPIGSLQPGGLVSGPFIESMKEPAKNSFALEAKQLSSTNSGESWRRLKVMLKLACGGKKKDTGFNTKPSLTCWDVDRI